MSDTRVIELGPDDDHFQGELYIGPVIELPDPKEFKPGQVIADAFVVGHSETGHHHVVARAEAGLNETGNPLIAYLEARPDKGKADLVHQRDHDTHPTLRMAMGGGKASAGPGKRLGRKVVRQREVTPERAGRTKWIKAAD